MYYNCTNYDGMFFDAIEKGENDIAKKFIDEGMSIEKFDWRGWVPVGVLELHEMDLCFEHCQTPIIIAAINKNTEMMIYLLYKGANYKYKDAWGKSLLDYLEGNLLEEMEEHIKNLPSNIKYCKK